jgi:hypothetical protein
MSERLWNEGHDGWHIVRQCGTLSMGSPLCARPELIAADQLCSNASDGYQFLVAHRDMILGLKQAFPQHADLFAGFPSFPYNATDVPVQWRSRFGTGWSQQILNAARILDNIESNLGQFPTEGDLGRFMQCGAGGFGLGLGNGVHNALHFKWNIASSPHALGNQRTNLGNYMFWKLHGWIDDVWERYRVAKGLRPDDAKLKQDIAVQCREMQNLGRILGPSNPNPTTPLPPERGYFHESVRPILEENCGGCHSAGSPEGGLPLAGAISSADIVARLVNVQAARGGQFRRIVPNAPEQSWLYLKVAGLAATAGCVGTCNTQVMPPAGQVTLTQAQLGIIRQWIASGAPAPTQ